MTNRLSMNANKFAVVLLGKPSQVYGDLDITINDIRFEVQSINYLAYICIYI